MVLLRISQILQENTCVGFPFNNVPGLKVCNSIKKRLQHKCFPVKFAKLLKIPPTATSELCSSGNFVNTIFFIDETRTQGNLFTKVKWYAPEMYFMKYSETFHCILALKNLKVFIHHYTAKYRHKNKITKKPQWAISLLKARMHCETFLSEHFMKCSFKDISWNTKYFHGILLP